ncbi:UNVERIFIED_ORG: hypothetical protein ABIC97_004584 [Peribacillus simplex]
MAENQFDFSAILKFENGEFKNYFSTDAMMSSAKSLEPLAPFRYFNVPSLDQSNIFILLILLFTSLMFNWLETIL